MVERAQLNADMLSIIQVGVKQMSKILVHETQLGPNYDFISFIILVEFELLYISKVPQNCSSTNSML